MKPILLDVLACTQCGDRYTLHETMLVCLGCSARIPLVFSKPAFTPAPESLQPSEKLQRGPNVGTPWRQANWRFLSNVIDGLPGDALILDVGAGRGDFADLFSGSRYIGLDIYPYPEVDLACDLTLVNPFRTNSFDAVLLMNVLEHVYDSRGLLRQLCELLKPGGLLVVAVPFMVKIHQAPVDFARYTQYNLVRMGEEQGLLIEQIEGFYDPISLLGEALGNLRHSILPRQKSWRHYAGRLALLGLDIFSSFLRFILGAGKVLPVEASNNPAPTGYQICYRKP